jgi:hypothetical protein
MQLYNNFKICFGVGEEWVKVINNYGIVCNNKLSEELNI